MEAGKLRYILQLADNVMILGQRLAEWCGHGPILEQDIAITNISLDLIGEARYLYQYAARLEGNGRKEDDYPFLRREKDFYNCQLTELPNRDWAYTLIRQCMFDCFHSSLLNSLKECNDIELKSIAQKTVKEAQYHLRYSSEWVIRLGDGTKESHDKMQKALTDYAPYFEELFIPSDSDLFMQREMNAPDLLKLKDEAYSVFGSIVHEATLIWNKAVVPQKGGKSGNHTEHMGYILTELQYMQRTYPNLEW
jgi:ring-1,2-phenylacetyl-CoA epoxidase subunit PaaC